MVWYLNSTLKQNLGPIHTSMFLWKLNDHEMSSQTAALLWLHHNAIGHGLLYL